MNNPIQDTFAALLHEIKTGIGQSPANAVRSVEFCCSYPIVNAVRSQLNRTNTIRNNELNEMYLITSAVRSQLSQERIVG